MKYQRFDNKIVVKLDVGDPVKASLLEVAEKEDIRAAEVTGLGAVDDVNLAFFHKADQKYEDHQLNEEFELLSLVGNLSRNKGQYHAHLHIVLGRSDLSVIGAHLNEAITSVTVEMVISILPGTIERYPDKEIGLDLMDL